MILMSIISPMEINSDGVFWPSIYIDYSIKSFNHSANYTMPIENNVITLEITADATTADLIAQDNKYYVNWQVEQ